MSRSCWKSQRQSAEVILGFMEEFIEASERLQGMLKAAEQQG